MGRKDFDISSTNNPPVKNTLCTKIMGPDLGKFLRPLQEKIEQTLTLFLPLTISEMPDGRAAAVNES